MNANERGSGKEQQQVEWKASWRDEYLKWIAGFANADGGTLVIGKDNHGKTTGIPNASRLLEDIPNKVRDTLGIIVDVDLVDDGGKECVEIRVDPYPYPVSYKGQYHYRSGSTKQELKGAALDRFILSRQGRHWDGVPVPNVNAEDLDPAAFSLFRTMAHMSGRMKEAVLNDGNEAILENLQLTEGKYVKRAAVLLFHPDPERYVPGAYVKIAFFRTDADLSYQDEVHGNLLDQAAQTLDLLLTKYMKAYITYEGRTRVERFLFPRNALREVLLNAIVHRDYSTGAPIQIRVYEDRIRFWNDGQLPEGWTLKRLLGKHSSKPCNPLIAHAFFRTGDIEAWGRGIDKIRDACREHGADFPDFDAESDGLSVEFHGTPPADDGSAGAGQETRAAERLVEGLVEGLVESQKQILMLILDNPSISKREMADKVGISTTAIDKNLTALKKKGLLERVGPDRGGHWKVIRE